MSTATDQYVSQNQQRFLDELLDFLRIPSISTLPENKGDVARAAEFTAAKMKTAGLENIEIIPTAGHPLVYADWLHAAGKPTVLCYGHYDVQPPDPIELWHHAAVRAHHPRRQHLRARLGRRQRPDVHAHQSRRGAALRSQERCRSI